MPLQTLNGVNPSGGLAPSAAASGLKEWGSSDAPAASDFNTDFRDEQEPSRNMLLAGLLAGGVCTASALNITVPVGTTYYARNVWQVVTSVAVIAVPDNSTTYLWGCYDGQIRLTASTTPPTSFDNTTACILTKAVAVSGAATVDNSVQQWARVAYSAAHVVAENNPFFAGDMDTIPAGVTAILAAGSQKTLFGPVQVTGNLKVYGRMRITT